MIRNTIHHAPGQLWLALRVPALRLSILQALVLDPEQSAIPWSELEKESVPESVAGNTRQVMDWMAPLSGEATTRALNGAGE